MNRKPKTATHRAITVMVRYTLEEYEAIVEAAQGEQIAVHVRQASLRQAAPAPDCDPRVVEVTLRSPGGHVDGVVGVYTLSVAAGMIALRRAAGWTASYRIVDEQPKVGPPLVDVAKLVAEFNAAADFRHAAIAAERLASSPLATKGRKP